ncbi:MAG: alkaline phosphatase D family protein [Candidatus Rariloculaceae bacterium]
MPHTNSLLIARQLSKLAVVAVALLLTAGCLFAQDGPYQATGIKIGEVSDNSAIVWTRLTGAQQRIGEGAPIPDTLYIHPESGEIVQDPTWPATPEDWAPVIEYPVGATIDNIEGAVPGSAGESRVLYRARGADEWQATPWLAVDPDQDFTRQFELTGLQPATDYELQVEARAAGAASIGSTIVGSFRSAPPADEPVPVVFAAITGQAYPDQDAPGGGFKIYPAIQALEPDFFVHTGDILYYDQWGKNLELARWGWARMFSLPTNFDFHRVVPTYFMKDDHDTLSNDSWPTMQSEFMGDFTFEMGQAVFLEQIPMGDSTYRTYRWGQDLQVWMVENRDFRSANTDPDGPEKTIWGAEQKAWFFETVATSDATFKILISPTPMLGPYNAGEIDNHTNLEGFYHEGEEIRAFLASQDNMIVICGDRHYQYIVEHAETGLREYATGPASDAHARGWRSDDVRPEHRYLNVVGGFVSVTAERLDGEPTLTIRHHDVDGAVLNEDVHVAE